MDKIRQREWLVSPDESHPIQKMAYGAEFNPLTPGGWDEMFPTIIGCPYPGPGEYHGVALPDHGEAWTLPWDVQQGAANELVMRYSGRALPYEFQRSISLGQDGTLTFAYQVRNLGPDPIDYLWAAHPQFKCQPGTRIQLPEAVREVVNVLPLDWGPEWGPPGSVNAWPEIPPRNGYPGLRQDLVGSPELNRGRKFYLEPEHPIGWVALVDEHQNCQLHMSWDPDFLPYCGIWIDEGALNRVASVAIEPTSGYYDDLSLAWEKQRLASIQTESCQSWTVTLTLADAGL